MQPIHSLLAAALVAAVPVPAAWAQQVPAPATAAPASAAATLSADDRAFLKQATESSLAELQASRVALAKARDEDIRGFAQRMVDDHTRMGEQLQRLAARKDVQLPDEPGIVEQVQLQLLQASEGERFEQRYDEQFGAKAHHATIALYEQQLERGKDPEVLAFARQAMPQLREHLQMAEDLQAALDRKGAGGSVMGAPR